MKPLDKGIAKLVARGLKAAKMTFPATLVKVTTGARTNGNLGGGKAHTETPFRARGFVPKKTATKIADTLIEANDRVVALLGATIASNQFPTTQDKLTIGGETLAIVAVETDAAKALYVCLCRK